MHVTTTNKILFWWWLSLFIKIINALNYTDFGLPNKNSCAFYYNQTVYIFNQENYSLSISFGNPWNTNLPTILKHNITTKTKIACSITRSGKIILLQQQLPQQQQQPSLLQFIDNSDITSQSWHLSSDITYLGSQNAIDSFITKPSISNFASTTFNDYVMIFGGEKTTNYNGSSKLLQSTFILDTRYTTEWIWYELPIVSTTPPPTSNSTLYSTSRWILHFRTEPIKNTTLYTTFIDCFDPYGFQWFGTISSFDTSTNSTIQIVPVVSSAIGSDSLLLWSLATQDETAATINQIEIGGELWKLDISTWIPSNFTLTKLNSSVSIHQSDISTSASTSNTSVKGQPSVVVTLNNNDLALLYGGGDSQQQQQQQLQFFNTTSLAFLPQPHWLQQQQNNSTTAAEDSTTSAKIRNLPIILGSVIGGVLFIALIILFFWCFYYKNRKRSSGNTLLRPTSYNNNNEKPSSFFPLSKKLRLFLLGNKGYKTTTTAAAPAAPAYNNNNDNTRIDPNIHGSSSISQFTLSPIKPLSPITLFPLPSDHPASNADASPTNAAIRGVASSSAAAATTAAAADALQQQQDEGIVQPQQQEKAKKIIKSRFREHFDYQSFSLDRNNEDEEKHLVASKSLPLESSSSSAIVTTREQEEELPEKKIPRSVSSYV